METINAKSSERIFPPLMPKRFSMEWTVSTYPMIVPIITSIQAVSLVLDQSIMAKNEAKAPNTRRHRIKTSWDESMF